MPIYFFFPPVATRLCGLALEANSVQVGALRFSLMRLPRSAAGMMTRCDAVGLASKVSCGLEAAHDPIVIHEHDAHPMELQLLTFLVGFAPPFLSNTVNPKQGIPALHPISGFSPALIFEAL
ncbi:MAG TPA: hypothetical protein VG796_24830 [Verrucomicrobiales bacterium]|nr:hypothetical protein [Verrucomicrobiales bacterium]